LPSNRGNGGICGDIHPLWFAAHAVCYTALHHTMISSRFLLLAGLALITAFPALGDTNIGVPINNLPAFLGVPGKYRLTKNFNFNKDGVAIVIAARDVVLDLNGFTINGPADADDSSVCVRITGPNAIVRNGTIRRFHTGVEDDSDDAIGTLLEDLQLINQHSVGVRLDAGESLLRRLRIRGTGTGDDDGIDSVNGIFLTGSATIENCLIQNLESHNGIPGPAGMRLVNGKTYAVRECDLVDIPGTGIAYGGDVSGILEEIRIRIASIGLNVIGGEAPLLRDSTFRRCTTTTSGPVDDGGRNQLTTN